MALVSLGLAAPEPCVLFVTSECAPWAKTGGLGDVAAALPSALRAFGCDVRVLMPLYSDVEVMAGSTQVVATVLGAVLKEARLPSGVSVLLIDKPDFFGRPGGLYQDVSGMDWPDNPQRFGLLSQVAAVLSSDQSPLSWRPNITHCNDWQTGLVPAWMHFMGNSQVKSVMTIHNMAFQGSFPPSMVEILGLPRACFQPEGAEFYGQLSFLKAGLFYADAITTVSPTYAQEIQGPLGFGMEGLLQARRVRLRGILNGIDVAVWNPATDPLIPARYDLSTLTRKAVNKAALQKAMQLPQAHDRLVCGVVSRLTQQKGIDLVIEVAGRLIEAGAQLVVLGSGEPDIEKALRQLAQTYPHAVAVHVGFDEGLAHLIEAGADLFLMPSRFEPCGLNQMYSQRYGTPPVARVTGGLADTIIAYQKGVTSGSATGFLFPESTADSFWQALNTALIAYKDKILWHRIQCNGMQCDFSWRARVADYVSLYHELLGTSSVRD